MKINAIILVIILITNQCYAQCHWQDFFTVKSGMSKFDAIKNLSLQNGVTEIEDLGLLPALAIVDKGEKEGVVTYLYNSNCLHGSKPKGNIYFKKDKLYKIDFDINYPPNELKTCIVDVEKLIKEFSSTFPVVTKAVTRNEDNEKIHDSYYLFRNKEQEINYPYEVEYVSIHYELYQKSYYSEIYGKWIKDPEILGFFLRISYYDYRIK